MSKENVAVVRRSIDAFGQGDLDGVLETLAPEFEFDPGSRFMDLRGVYRGRGGWAEFWAAFRAAWADVVIDIERIEDLDDRVLTLGHIHGRGGESGVEVDVEAAWLHTVRNGLIVHLRSFPTWNEALAAAGLAES